MRKLYAIAALFLFTSQAFAQVDVVANSTTTTYANLKLAFDAVNAGTHTGAITINITGIGTYTNPSAPAVLNSTATGSANYSSILIQPTADAVTVNATTIGGRGVIELNGADNVTINGDNPNTAGTNRNLTIQHTAAATTTYTSVIRVMSTNVAEYNTNANITITNLILLGNVTSGNSSSITSTTGSSNASFGVIVGPNGGASPSTITGVTTSMSTTSPAPTVNSFTVSNCSINQVARGISFLGGNAASSNGVTITNNVIGDQATTLSGTPPFTSPATTVYTKGILVTGTTSLTITGNTIKNILSYVGTGSSGIELNSAIGATGGTLAVSNNTVEGIVNNGTSAANGILVSSSTIALAVNGNTVNNIQTVGSSSAAGINLTTSATVNPTITVDKNIVSTVYARNTGGYAARGILVSSGNNLLITNNFVRDLLAANNNSTTSTSFAVKGISLGSGTGHKVYHNTVHLSGTMFGSNTVADNTTCLMISAASQTGIDIRNNIFSNFISSDPACVNACLQLPSGATSTMALTLNNNAYLTGTAANQYVLILQASFTGYSVNNFNANSTSGATNARTYTSTLGSNSNDANSFTGTSSSVFVSSSDLHLNLGTTANRYESGGASVGITTDYDNQVRPGPTGSVNGGANAADIGADEFDGVPLDQASPTISYTAISGTLSTTNRVLTGFAAITDNSGVNVTAGTAPRLYFKKSGDANDATGWKYVEASNATSPFSFTIDYSSLTAGSVTTGDVIQYFITAQDNATTPNVAINSGSFAATPSSVSLTSAAFPIGGTINSYLILAPLSGTKTVCPSGCDYTTLTIAGGVFEAINNNGLNGNLVVEIAGNLSETGAVALNQWVESNGSNYTLNIYPTGVARTISGTSASALIKLNGADRVTIDGSIGGNTTTRDLTISNSNTGTSSAVIWVGSASASDGANNTTVRNCVINGNASTTTLSGIIQSSGTSMGGVAESANTNNTYQNNQITTAQYGIALVGPTVNETGNVITGNFIGSTVAANKIGLRAIGLFQQSGINVSGNQIAGVLNSGSTNVSGIYVAGTMVGGTINGNFISDVKNTSASGWGSAGVVLASSSTTNNVAIVNNSIWDISSYGYTGTGLSDNGYGVVVSTGGGYSLFHNSVNMATSQTLTSGTTAGLMLISGLSSNAIDVRNNIFVNTQTVGSRYAIYSASASTAFTNIDNNNYFVGSGGVLGYITSDRTTLAALRTGFGGNLNSVNTNPNFTSATNLLPTSGQLATNITGVTTDILNITRRTPTSIGAYAVNTAGVWSATAASTDYTAASNWRDNLPPTATTAVYIPAASTNWPNIAANTTIYQLQNLGTLTSDAAATVTITDNVSNTGTINAGGGVTIGGTTAQTIATGTASSNFNVATLTLNNSTGATLSGSGRVNVTGTYTGTSGTLTAGGRLVFKSTATGSARHASGTINGNVVVERYITPKLGGRKSLFLASPVTANLNSAGWQQQIHITGVVGTCTGGVAVPANAFDATLLGNPSMFTYNDANAGGAKWVAIPTTNQNLVPGTGYRVLVRGPRSQGCTLLTTTPAQDEVTLSATGVLAQGNQTLTSISAGLFQLTGNPYASSIDFDAVKTSAGANIEASYWTYNPANAAGVFSVYNDGSITNTLTMAPGGYLNHGIIASGQAFFIKRTSGNLGNLSGFYQDAHKVATAQNGLFRTSNTRSWQKLARVAVQAAGDSSLLEDAVIRFGTTGIQKDVLGNSDAEHLSNAATQLASRKAGQWQAIQTRPVITSGDDTVALRLTSPGAASLQLSLTELVDMTGIQVILRDKQLGTTTPLALNQPIAIQVTSNPASQGSDRFELIFRNSATLASKFTSIKASRSASLARNEVRFTAQEDGGTNEYQLEASANGGQSFEPVSGATTPGSRQAGQFSYQLNDERAITATQTVHYRIKASGNAASYSQVVKVDAKAGAQLTVKAYPNPVTDVLNIQLTGTTGQVDIRLLDAQGRVVLSQRQTVNGQQTISLATKQLASGKYLLQATGKGGETLATQSIVKE